MPYTQEEPRVLREIPSKPAVPWLCAMPDTALKLPPTQVEFSRTELDIVKRKCHPVGMDSQWVYQYEEQVLLIGDTASRIPIYSVEFDVWGRVVKLLANPGNSHPSYFTNANRILHRNYVLGRVFGLVGKLYQFDVAELIALGEVK